MERGARQAIYSPWGRKETDTTEVTKQQQKADHK